MAQVDERIRRLVDDMLATMYEADGVGLAATQVDVHERVIVMDTSDTRDKPLVIINPEIVSASTDMLVNEEGCLSVPTIYDRVERHAQVTVRFIDRQGEVCEVAADGRPGRCTTGHRDLTAVCVQHEMDHLVGKVFVEYLSPLKRDRIKSKMLKKTRDEQVRGR